MPAYWTIANLLILLINVGVLGLGLKLYTEIFKNHAMDKRSKKEQS